MANTTTSTYMSLQIPIVSQQTGPEYATNVNTALTVIDAHDHTSGNGQQVPSAGISINADLSFGGYNATSFRSVRYTSQASPIAQGTDLGCTYVAGVDLYYNDTSGNQVRLTQNGSVAGTPGSITNLLSPASVSYVAGNSTFVFQSTTATAANIDVGSVKIREVAANANAVTISSPAALAANYTLTLPAAVPASSSRFVSVDTSGNLAFDWRVDQNTLEISANVVQVKNGGITPPKMGTLNQQVSGNSGTVSHTGAFTDVLNQSIIVTTNGRPVMLALLSATTGTSQNSGYWGGSVVSGSLMVSYLRFVRNEDPLAVYQSTLSIGGSGATNVLRSNPPFHIDVPPASSSYTYKLQIASEGANSGEVNNLKLFGYQI